MFEQLVELGERGLSGEGLMLGALGLSVSA
jgi:hypothetical protein